MCGRKISYPSAAKARKYARKGREKQHIALRVYACDACKGWHLTKDRAKM